MQKRFEGVGCKTLLFLVSLPAICSALTSGPAMPEYNDFSPIDGTDLVNLVSGDFSYNIPVMTVPGPGLGFPLVLNYHGGILQKQEATWIGLGWNVQAGAITRQVNQVPDDFKGDELTENIRSSSIHGWYGSVSYDGVTIGLSWDNVNGQGGMVGYSFSLEKYGGPSWAGVGIRAGANGVYEGIGVSIGVNGGIGGKNPGDMGVGGSAAIGLSSNDGISVSGGVGLAITGEQGKISNQNTHMSLASVGASLSSRGGLNGSANLGVMASQQMSVRGESHSSSSSWTIPFYFYGYGELNWGEWSNWIEGHGSNKYYGFLYEDKAGMSCLGNSGSNVNCTDNHGLVNKKMEFTGFKGAFPRPIPASSTNKPVTFAKLMSASPDMYTVATQGLSGVFRPNRKEDGDYLNNLEPRSESYTASCDVALIDFLTSCTRHTDYNRTVVLEEQKNLHNQAAQGMGDVYWRFTDDFGGAEFTDPTLRDNTAEVSVQSKKIQPYFDSEGKIIGFAITKEDGVRYIYSYVLKNLKEMKLAHEAGSAIDVSTDQTIPSYAYAWLLTAIESPDYVDMIHTVGDCTPDHSPCLPQDGDVGGWIRFDYGLGNPDGDETGINEKAIFNWRTPYLGAAGANTNATYLPNPQITGIDNNGGTNDDGYNWRISHTASEGIKEVSYLMKVETPTHIARFHMSDRQDGSQSVLTNLQRFPPKITEDFQNNRTLISQPSLVVGNQYDVRITYKIQVLRDKPTGCDAKFSGLPNVSRNEAEYSNKILIPPDTKFIERSGFQSNPSFFNNCLNSSLGPEICSSSLFIDEFTNQSFLVHATAETCDFGGVSSTCVVVFNNQVREWQQFDYGHPESEDALNVPGAIPVAPPKSIYQFYNGYCNNSPTNHVKRYYAERRAYAASILTPIPDTRLKKLDYITLHNKLAGGKEVAAVQLKYDYSLVPGTPNSNAENAGKLTLKKVRLGASMNGPWMPDYRFDYQADNPTYQGAAGSAKLNYETQESWDRWGYHCTSCKYNDHESDGTAAVWNLEQITMPSGGKIKVEFEPKLFHTTLQLNGTSIEPWDLTDRGNTDPFLIGSTRNGHLAYSVPSINPFVYSVPSIISGLTPKASVDLLGIDGQQKGREIDHYDLHLKINRLDPSGSGRGFLLMTRKGATNPNLPINTGNPPAIRMIPIQLSDMTDHFNHSLPCRFGPPTCDYEKTITISAAEYQSISADGFDFNVFSYDEPCRTYNHCVLGEACLDCHYPQPADNYPNMTTWMFPGGGTNGTNIEYDITSWFVPRNSRIGGGVRVARLSTIEPFSGKANVVEYQYGNGVTPTLPATFGAFDDRKLNGSPFFPLDVGYENFVGSAGVIYDKVSTVFKSGSGPDFHSEYSFITAKDLPTQFSSAPKIEYTETISGSLNWQSVVQGQFIGAPVQSPNQIDLEPLKQVASAHGWKIEAYKVELQFTNINSPRTWRTSATANVNDVEAMNCAEYPIHFLMLDDYGAQVTAGVFSATPLIASGNPQYMPIFAIHPDHVSSGTSPFTCSNFQGHGAGGIPPYRWPETGLNAGPEQIWNGTRTSIVNGKITMSIPAAVMESYRAKRSFSTLHIEPRLVRKNQGAPGFGYGVQDFHLDFTVTAVGSPLTTPRNFYRVTVQDYSSLWGNLWKKEDFAAGSATPVTTNLIKWRFNDGWMSLTPNSSFQSETQGGTTTWTKKMGETNQVNVVQSYLKRNGKPFVQAESETYKPYFGLNQSLASYRYFGNYCDAEVNNSNQCTSDNIVVTQTVHQRFLPQVAENTVIQDGLSSTTFSSLYDFRSGLPLKNRSVNSDQSVLDIYSQPAYYQYPDMASRNQLTQMASTTNYFYSNSAPALTDDPIPSKAVSANYTRWRPYNVGGPIFPYRQSEGYNWRNKDAAGGFPVTFGLPDDRCPANALPDGTIGAPATRVCADQTSSSASWLSAGRNSVYDPFGHVLEFVRPDGTKISQSYAYKSSLVNAFALRAGSDEFFHESFEVSSEIEANLYPGVSQNGHGPVSSYARSGVNSLLIQNSPGADNSVCFALPRLHKNKQYLASVWYYDATSGNIPSDVHATRAGIFIGEPGTCHAELYPEGAGSPPLAPSDPMRATGSKSWKRIQVSFTCADPSADQSKFRVCLYASHNGEGAEVYYDELRVQPRDAMLSTFAYDAYGKIISSSDPRDIVTSYEYDPFGNLTGIRNDDGILLGSKAQQYGRTGK